MRKRPPRKLFNWRNTLAFGHDVVAAAASWLIAYLLRFNFEIPSGHMAGLLGSLPWAVGIQSGVFLCSGMYRGLWRYASLSDLRKIVVWTGLGTLCLALVVVLLRLPDVPRSVIVIYPVLLSVLMGGTRVAYRTWKEGHFPGFAGLSASPVLIVGVNELSERLIRELKVHRTWRVVSMVDVDYAKHGRFIHGIKVAGGLDAIPTVVKRYGLLHAIIALPNSTAAVRRRAVRVCTNAGLEILTVPSASDVLTGNVTVSQLRQVEVDDLLGRDPVVMDTVLLNEQLKDRRVLVTGAGGSIGSELCRQIMKFGPRKLGLLDLSEHALYTIEQQLRERYPAATMEFLLGDAKDESRVDQIFRRHEFDVVFHAAAYKHVPLVEAQNTWQAIRNNVLSTRVLTRAAARHRVGRFVLISTDKAVNPTNVMGASKRLAEMLCQSAATDSHTKYVVVRFGNVLGSTGSVVPKFKEQIARGGPITVTHPEITRYFMSIPEAAQLVLQAAAMGKGGEIYVLDMGEPVKIVDLARDMIRLSGMALNDIEITFTGLRAGEKLYEELLADDEHTLPTPHSKLRIARAREVTEGTIDRIVQWVSTDATPSDEVVREQLRKFVPEYVSTTESREVEAAQVESPKLRIAAGG